MTTIIFDVVGTPAPQGSKSAMMIAGKPRLIEGKGNGQRARHKSWRAAVADAARQASLDIDAPLDGPLSLDVTFRASMATSRPKRLRAIGRIWKTSAPDLDKLIRSTGDALKEGGLIIDDARIALVIAEKLEVVGWTGATITITQLETS